MPVPDSPILRLRQAYLEGQRTPADELAAALRHSNANASHNTYLAQDTTWSEAEAARLRREDIATQPLWGVPVSLKDCFDLAGFTTSCGTHLYRELHGTAPADSAVAARLRAAGAVLTGKTHLHPLAYGITGQNPEFGDCLQPVDLTRLTGGSSSGAAASVQEGSALAAVGTDTGGSIRVPAALCGLVGYRSSHALNTADIWRGGAHLSPSFDTLGWLYRDLGDGPLLGHALLGLPMPTAAPLSSLHLGAPADSFLHDCEPAILATLQRFSASFADHGAAVTRFDAAIWEGSLDIFAPIQASEAAQLHRGHLDRFEPAIAERLRWGASLTADELTRLHQQLDDFRQRTEQLFARFDYLLLPCAPVSALPATADHSHARAQILRYTTPISLCGLPAVTLTAANLAGGLQLVGPPGSDAALLALSTRCRTLLGSPA